MADYISYFNGEWIPVSQIRIDPLDRGFFVGDAVFDVERTFHGKSFRMKEHIDRLYRSLNYVRIDCGLSPEEMVRISEETIQRNEHLRAEVGDFYIHQFITRGTGKQAWEAVKPTVCVRIDPINFGSFARCHEEGMHGVITKTLSYPPDALEPKIKHYSRMNFNLAELEANDVDPGARPILRDAAGNLTEGAGFNVFMVTKGIIRTPGDRSILQGVSRSMVFDLARKLEIPIAEENLQPYDLYTSDEAFFTSTSYCVAPVTQIDRRTISDGKPGQVTKQLLAAWSEAVGLDIVEQTVRFGSKQPTISHVQA